MEELRLLKPQQNKIQWEDSLRTEYICCHSDTCDVYLLQLMGANAQTYNIFQKKVEKDSPTVKITEMHQYKESRNAPKIAA